MLTASTNKYRQTNNENKHKYNEKQRKYEKEKLERFRKFSYETNTKLSRLSHEELMIPLIYWNCPPQHKITAMYIQKSMRSGDIIITGSENGEFIIWKPYNTIHQPPSFNNEEEEKKQEKQEKIDNMMDNEHWIPIAMTFSTNTSPVVSILGSFQHKEQAAFMAAHADGETVIFSVYGAGALKIGCGERPILKDGVSGIYGYGLSNESYQYCVCTNFYNHNLHIIDLHKGKQINYNLNNNILPMQIIDITFFQLQLSSHCAIIDKRGKIATFSISDNNTSVEPQLNFESRLKNEPINIGITFDNQYLCAISKNEFVLFANDPLRFISYINDDNIYWDGMTVLDKYFYGIIDDKIEKNRKKQLFQRSNSNLFKTHPSLNNLVDSGYIFSSNPNSPSAPDPTIDTSYSSLPSVTTTNNTTPTTGYNVNNSNNNNNDNDNDEDQDDNVSFIRPFFVLLWQNDSKYLTLYLVSKEAPSILTPIVDLIMPIYTSWKVVTNDNRNIYVGTRNSKIILFSMDDIQEKALKSIDIIQSKQWDSDHIGCLKGKIVASIQDGFSTKMGNIDKKEKEEEEEEEEEEDKASKYYSEIGIEDDSDITSSCMNITSLGVLICIGYNDGEIYIYNVSEGEAVMEIHSRLSSVNSLLLLCSDSSANDNIVGDGVLFVGYNDGFIEAFNCKSGELMISKKCHYGGVSKILAFEQDYYVFSIGEDNALCSFLVYSQLITMKSVQDLFNETDPHDIDRNVDDFENGSDNTDSTDSANNIRINWYRGHTDSIVAVYRDQWCLISDLVCCELSNGEIYVWCVSTAQLERRFLSDKSLIFNIDRSFYQCRKRGELPHLTKHEREIYKPGYNTNLSSYCNILMLDIRVLGDVTLDREYNMLQRHSDDFDQSPDNNPLCTGRRRKNIDSSEISKLSDLLSLLLDWGIGAEYECLFIQQFRILITDISPCYGYCGDFESQTLLFPISSCFGGRWRIQPKVTAVYMLCINTICMWLLQCAPTSKLPVCSRLVTYYHVMLPESFNGFVEPSRNSMARYCLNSVSEIRAASRMLLHGIVQRMTDPMRLSLISKWKKRFCHNQNYRRNGRNTYKNKKTRKNGHVFDSSLSSLPSKPYKLTNAAKSNETVQSIQSETTTTISTTPPIITTNTNNNNSAIIGRNGKIPLSVLLGAIVICIIHSLKRNVIEDIVSESVINTLICVLMEKVHTNSDMIKISLSCDYLGKVIISWFRYVDDVEYLLKTLLDLRNCDHFLLKKSASSALLQCGVAVPQSFIKTMGNEALIISGSGSSGSPSTTTTNKSHTTTSSEFDNQINGQKEDNNNNTNSNISKQDRKQKKAKRHEQALMCIINLVQKYPQVLLKHIPLLVSTIIRCLDPSAPRRRKALLSATTASLHVLVTKYPNVAFHQETQHFAIGTGPARDNCILIYDLRTTTRWKQLKGHRAAVTAIEFNYNGSYLISYSAYERPPTVKCWDIGSGGFINSLFGSLTSSTSYSSGYGSNGNSKCIKTCPMPPLDRLYPPIDHLQYTKLTWNNKVKGAVKLQRENQSVLFFTVLPK